MFNWLTARFRSTSQLAHMSAHDVHEMQIRMRDMHREWEGIKKHLKEISDASRDLPKGQHHDVMQKIFTHVDGFSKSTRTHEKHMHHLEEYIKGFAKQLEQLEKD